MVQVRSGERAGPGRATAAWLNQNLVVLSRIAWKVCSIARNELKYVRARSSSTVRRAMVYFGR